MRKRTVQRKALSIRTSTGAEYACSPEEALDDARHQTTRKAPLTCRIRARVDGNRPHDGDDAGPPGRRLEARWREAAVTIRTRRLSGEPPAGLPAAAAGPRGLAQPERAVAVRHPPERR